jgi:hypothetical protein
MIDFRMLLPDEAKREKEPLDIARSPNEMFSRAFSCGLLETVFDG